MINVIYQKDEKTGKGKTDQLIELCSDKKGVYVCSTELRKADVIKKSQKLNKVLPEILTINEMFYTDLNFKKEYFFEDVHVLIKVLFSDVKIGAMSINVKSTDE